MATFEHNIEEEQQLIQRTIRRDRDAFHQLYTRYVGRVYAICYRLLGDKPSADDVTQEVFISVWENIGKFTFSSQFSTWLHAVATNIAVTHFRKRSTWLQRFFSQSIEDVTEPTYVDGDALNGLDKHIVNLPDQARAVFVLFAVEGYRHEEIAQLLGIAVGSSKAQYHRARTLLKTWLSDE